MHLELRKRALKLISKSWLKKKEKEPREGYAWNEEITWKFLKKQRESRDEKYLNAGGIEGQEADLSSNITEYSQLNTVVQGGVTDQIGSVSLKEINAIHSDGGIHLALAVRVLKESRNGGSPKWNSSVHDREPGFLVLDSNFIRVNSCENHPNVEGKRGGGGIGIGYAHVLDTHLLEIELGFLGFEGEDDNEDDGED